MEHLTHIGFYEGGYGPVAVSLTREQRYEHLALLGATGVGKSSLLRSIAAQDIARGDGLLYLDPHGDDAAALLDSIPPWRQNHVCYFNLADLEWPIAINVLEHTHPDDRAATADALVSALRDIWFDSMTAAPRMENVLRHATIALLDVPKATIALIPRLLTDDTFRMQVVPHISNPVTRAFFEDRFEGWRDAFRAEAIEPVLTRLDAVLSFPAVLNSLGQYQRTLRIENAMLGNRIVIVNLAKGLIGETAAHLMGALLIARVRAATMARARMAPQDRRDFHVLVDELQNFATNSVPSLLAEARKYRVSFAFATQILSALSERTRAALLGTTGSIAAFRLGPEDAAVIGPRFNQLHRDFNEHLLYELDRAEAIVRVGAHDFRRVACSLPPTGYGSGGIVRRQSRRHYARPRSDVERWVRRMMRA